MAKVTDIQDKNGATREIQDKDLANRTSQSSIASSDYVLLEDTNGAYHKIAKASFTEAVRGALGSVINSVAKGTDIAKVPVLDSNNDLGMGTLSNLASVLGGIVINISSREDLNNLTRQGVIYMSMSGTTSQTLLNRPSNLIEAFILKSPTPNVQLIVTTWSVLKLYKRSYDNGWGKWQLVTGTEVEYA